MKIIERKDYLDRLIRLRDTPDIKIITGLRRSGKSELVRAYMELIRTNEDTNIIYVDFADLKFDDLKTYKELYNFCEGQYIDGKTNVIVVDEVQMCEKFELAINSLYNRRKYDIYITGSNAFLLSSDLSTLFTGRFIEIPVYPFSFAEYCEYYGYDSDEANTIRYLDIALKIDELDLDDENKKTTNSIDLIPIIWQNIILEVPLKVISPDGRIHTNFQMTVTATGRLSSTEPNLQNIPVRRQLGSQIRRMFIPREGYVLVDADYSQIELRLLAHISRDQNMINAFLSGEDFHAVTASNVFGVPLQEVTHEMRSRAKAVNFGIVYGISAFSLSQDIGVTPREAQAYMDAYFLKYPDVKRYMVDIVEKAEKDGYVTTLYGRRRDIPELRNSKYTVREFGKRVALNMPIQGTAADIIKMAMIDTCDRLKENELSAKLVLQVHDELIVECPEEEVVQVCDILKNSMCGISSLSVPLVVDVKTGSSWAEAH